MIILLHITYMAFNIFFYFHTETVHDYFVLGWNWFAFSAWYKRCKLGSGKCFAHNCIWYYIKIYSLYYIVHIFILLKKLWTIFKFKTSYFFEYFTEREVFTVHLSTCVFEVLGECEWNVWEETPLYIIADCSLINSLHGLLFLFLAFG